MILLSGREALGSEPGEARFGRREPWVQVALAVLVILQLWSSMSSSFTSEATLVKFAALLCGLLAVFGLPSLPARSLVWLSTATSAVLLARFGMAGSSGGLASLWPSMLWLAATALALAVTAGHSGSIRWATAVPAIGSALVAVALIAGAALLVGPRLAGRLSTGSTIGEALDRSDNHPANPLDSSSSLDMTTRPELSDQVVVTVDSPVASFWRSEVYDVWDGTRWTRSSGRGGSLLADGAVLPPPEDLAGNNGEPFETEVRIEAGFATALPVAPSAVRVTAEGHQLAQRTDGTVVAFSEPLGRGATYRVTSRQIPLDVDQLSEAGNLEVPSGVSILYAQQPVSSQRTVELAQQVTAGVGGNYEKVLALERWMGTNTRYDIEAPLSPAGVDVVDHFLFESQLGWCEQIASSLVVMARAVGVPARLATGYVPGEWDAVSGRFIVRENHAHSWAEVWFPEVGWVPFDPTADVPLAGPAAVQMNRTSRAVDIAGLLLLTVALAFFAVPRLVHRVRSVGERVSSKLRRRRLERDNWDVAEEVAIESEVARLLGRPRGIAETLPHYADDAVQHGAEPGLLERAGLVETWRYGRPAS